MKQKSKNFYNLSTIRRWMSQAYRHACDAGFHNEHRSMKFHSMLVVTELSEAINADRRDRCLPEKTETLFSLKEKIIQGDYNATKTYIDRIKDSVFDELADAVLRLFDLIEYERLMNTYGSEKDDKWHRQAIDTSFSEDRLLYSITQLHGQSFPEQILHIVVIIAGFVSGDRMNRMMLLNSISLAVMHIFAIAEMRNVYLADYIELKLAYNSTRDPLHGKKY